jgi:putative transposase
MYRWRKLTAEDQHTLLNWRQRIRRPWHSPPHYIQGRATFHLTAACYEHEPLIGASLERMQSFTESLIETLHSQTEIHAWCVLPNHYHLLLTVPDLKPILRTLGQLHGRWSYVWNGEDGQRGRKVWSPPADRWIRSPDHAWATMNYIHHNPVKHGYVKRWQEWPFGSAESFLDAVGREEAKRVWRSYPVLDYGRGWDD